MPPIEDDNTEPMPPEGKPQPPVMTGDSGRQGPEGRRVLWILVIGLGAAVAVIGIYTLFFTVSTPA